MQDQIDYINQKISTYSRINYTHVLLIKSVNFIAYPGW